MRLGEKRCLTMDIISPCYAYIMLIPLCILLYCHVFEYVHSPVVRLKI